MCIDFRDLNKAWPKDSYPFLRINTLVDSTARHELLSFMDAFSGYNQIKMNEKDQEKTSSSPIKDIFATRWCRSDSRTQERRIKD